jgi:ABC-type transporter Mla subunit MlaD
MILNSFSTLFDIGNWETVTLVFAGFIAVTLFAGLTYSVASYFKWKRIFSQTDFGNKSLAASAQKYQRSFITGSDEKTRSHADEFFELRRLQPNTAVIDSLPNISVGLGILGTFVGLSIGVMGLKDQSSAEAIKTGVQELLGSMSTAFVTSVLGMATSLFLTVWLRFFNARTIRNHKRFCESLDEKHYIPDEQLSAIEQERLKNMLLELFGQRFNDAFRTPGDLLNENLLANQNAAGKLSDFGVELADGLSLSANTISAIEERLGDRFNSLFQTQLGSHIEKMSASLESIDSKETSQADSFKDTLEASLNKLIGQFQEGLSSGAREEMTSMQQNLAATSESLRALPQILDETKAGFTDMTRKFEDLGKELGERLAQQLQAASEQAAAAQKAGAEAAEKSLGNVAQLTNSVTQQMQDGMQKFMSSNSASVEGMNDLVLKIEGIIQSHAAAGDSIGSAITGLTTASQSLNSNTKSLDSAMGNLERMNNNMIRVSEGLGGVTAGLSTAIAEQHKAVETVFASARRGLEDQLAAYGDVNKELSGIKDAYIASLRNYQDSINAAVNTNLESFASQLGNVAEGLTQAYTALQETVNEMDESLSRHTRGLK